MKVSRSTTICSHLTRDLLKIAFPVALLAASATPCWATDHWDGPNVSARPPFDITDFFAFPTESDGQRRLVLIVNTHPAAKPDTRFDDSVILRIRLRKIQNPQGVGTGPFVTGEEEVRIECRAGEQITPQTMTCSLLHISQNEKPEMLATTEVNTNDPSGGGNQDLRVFAGNRADQSFTDLGRVRMPVWRNKSMADRPGVNGLACKNVLSVVTDINLSALVDDAEGIWAAVSETHLDAANDSKPTIKQIDRMGRIEVTVFLIQDDVLKDKWNATNSFAPIDPALAEKFIVALQSNMWRLDDFEKSLVGADVIDWPIPHPLRQFYLHDYLVLNLSKATTASSTDIRYLDNLMASIKDERVDSIGGRTPNEDVIARMMTIFINGPIRPEPNRGVGVNHPGKPAVDTFPYVLPPYGLECKAEQ